MDKRPLFEPLLTIKQAAELLNMSEKTVRRRIETKDLPVIRDGGSIRIRPDDLRAYIAMRRDA
jgi:excisionase family DNA binding protein